MIRTRIDLFADWTCEHFWHFVTGIFLVFISYFAEIKGAFHVMFAAFILDMILGVIASRKKNAHGFKMSKFFIAVERMLISFALVMILYAMDKEMKQDTVSLSNISSWLISGFLVYSAAENGFILTGNKLFLALKNWIKDKVKSNTGVDIDEAN